VLVGLVVVVGVVAAVAVQLVGLLSSVDVHMMGDNHQNAIMLSD